MWCWLHWVHVNLLTQMKCFISISTVFSIHFCHINKQIDILQNMWMCTYIVSHTSCDTRDNDNVCIITAFSSSYSHNDIAKSSKERDSLTQKKYVFVIHKGVCWAIGLEPRTCHTNYKCDKCHSILDLL